MRRARKPPRDWQLKVGRVYVHRDDPSLLVCVESEPHPRNPKLVSACDSDDGGLRRFSCLRAWRPIQGEYVLTEHASPEAAWRSAVDKAGAA